MNRARPLATVAPPVVKLLVLAQTPPPLHGQSVMVQAMLDGLATRSGLTLHHLNFRLSRDNADIGTWRPGKIVATLALALRAIIARFRHGCDSLYYVPSPPGKRGALYRDWVVLALCRPFFPRLILHWHAAGLADWLARDATSLERLLSRTFLGRAHLAIVLSSSLRHDAEYLRARAIAVVPNGIPDPRPSPRVSRTSSHTAPWRCLFLGLGCEEKGLFLAADAVLAANRRVGIAPSAPRFTLVAAGPFADAASAARFESLAAMHPDVLRHAGFVTGESKEQLLRDSDCLLFPSHYAAEGLPLAVIEALAHDLPVVATKWRGLPDLVAPDCGRLVPPRDSTALTSALLTLSQDPPPPGACRERFLREFTLDQHLATLAVALESCAPPSATSRQA